MRYSSILRKMNLFSNKALLISENLVLISNTRTNIYLIMTLHWNKLLNSLKCLNQLICFHETYYWVITFKTKLINFTKWNNNKNKKGQNHQKQVQLENFIIYTFKRISQFQYTVCNYTKFQYLYIPYIKRFFYFRISSNFKAFFFFFY